MGLGEAALGGKEREALLATKRRVLAERWPGLPSSVLPDDVLLRLVSLRGALFMPACAVLGGLLAQEVLKAMSRRDAPFHNWLLLDAAEGEATAMRVGV